MTDQRGIITMWSQKKAQLPLGAKIRVRVCEHYYCGGTKGGNITLWGIKERAFLLCGAQVISGVLSV